NKHIGSEGFLPKSTSATRSTPTESNCRTSPRARPGHEIKTKMPDVQEKNRFQSTHKFVFDHDAKYGLDVLAVIRSMKIACVQTSVQSPWQNGIAERWVGSCRRDLLD